MIDIFDFLLPYKQYSKCDEGDTTAVSRIVHVDDTNSSRCFRRRNGSMSLRKWKLWCPSVGRLVLVTASCAEVKFCEPVLDALERSRCVGNARPARSASLNCCEYSYGSRSRQSLIDCYVMPQAAYGVLLFSPKCDLVSRLRRAPFWMASNVATVGARDLLHLCCGCY